MAGWRGEIRDFCTGKKAFLEFSKKLVEVNHEFTCHMNFTHQTNINTAKDGSSDPLHLKTSVVVEYKDIEQTKA